MPEEYPWSSYHANALGKADHLVVVHDIYQALGTDVEERYKNYRTLFQHHIDEKELDEIRKAVDKAWVLGNDKFRTQIESLTKRQAAPKAKGGDRKPLNYRESSNINRVCHH